MAKSDQQKLKEKLDEVFSEYIRLRDSDHYGYCSCIICGARHFWKSGMRGINNGHFMSRSLLATRFDEDNCHAQCNGCNGRIDQKLMMRDFEFALVDKIGEERIKAIKVRSKETMKVDSLWYQEKIQYYKNKVAELLQQKQL
jgi:Bacteriophage Lambda NinG protein